MNLIETEIPGMTIRIVSDDHYVLELCDKSGNVNELTNGTLAHCNERVKVLKTSYKYDFEN